MINTVQLLYKADLRLNKLATNAHQEIPIEDKILIANESVLSLIKNKIGLNNIYRLGLDAFKKRYQDLQFLIESGEDNALDLLKTNTYLNKYSAGLNGLPKKLLIPINAFILADKGECKDRVIYVNPDLVKHGDIHILLKDSNTKPSFEYQETIGGMSQDEFHIYTDGTFTPKNLHLTYLRYPEEMDIEGYEHFDGTASVNKDCELEEYLENELLDIMVGSLAKYTENINAANVAKDNINTNE